MLETQSLDPEGKESRQTTLSRNVAASLASNILYLVTRLFIPPYILGYVTLSEYGLWSYCFVLISYLGMSVFGVNNVYVRYIAVYHVTGEQEKINRLITTGLTAVFFLCLLVIPLAWFLLPELIGLFAIQSSLTSLAFTLFFGTMLIFMIDLTLGAFGNVLQSLQRIVAERAIFTFSYLLETALIVIFLSLGWGIRGLLFAFFTRTLAAGVLYCWASFRYLPGLKLRLCDFSLSMLKLFFTFGGIVQISGILGVVNRSIEKVFSGLLINMRTTGLFELGEKFPVMALLLPGSANAAFLPANADLHTRGAKEEMKTLLIKGSRLINLLTGLMMGFMAAFAAPLISCWLGSQQYQTAAVILAFFSIAYQMDVLTGPASALYRGINKPIKELYYGLSQFIVVIALAALLFFIEGPSVMTIIGAVVPGMVATALAYLFLTCRQFNIPLPHFFFHILVPGLLPYLISFTLAYAMAPLFDVTGRWQLFGRLLLALTLYLPTTVLMIYFLFSTRQERKDFRLQITGIFKKNAP